MIKIGLAGYGNLGQGAEKAIAKNEDMALQAIFTRRDPKSIQTSFGTRVVAMNDLLSWQDKIDVMILCGGSATDLPKQGPQLAKYFHTVDSYDNHKNIPAYFAQMDQVAKDTGHLALIACGWDPGLFSLNRVLFTSILPQGKDYTFWGKGISQGHSDAIRRIPGVIDARQYTIPKPEALAAATSRNQPELTARERHHRECYVVAAPEADQEKIKQAIVAMPHYFADYDTSVYFISQEELLAEHGSLPHGGQVIRNAVTSEGTSQVAKFSLQLESNPEFTASVLTAYARAVYRLAQNAQTGAITVFDIPVGHLSPCGADILRRDYL